MIYTIDYILHYPKQKITKYQKVKAIDRTHAMKIFKNWVYKTYKKAKWVEIKY